MLPDDNIIPRKRCVKGSKPGYAFRGPRTYDQTYDQKEIEWQKLRPNLPIKNFIELIP